MLCLALGPKGVCGVHLGSHWSNRLTCCSVLRLLGKYFGARGRRSPWQLWAGGGGQKPLGVAGVGIPLLLPPGWFTLGPFFLIICHPWKRSHGGRIWPHYSLFSSNWLRKYGQGVSPFPSVALEDRSWLSHPRVWTQLQ